MGAQDVRNYLQNMYCTPIIHVQYQICGLLYLKREFFRAWKRARAASTVASVCFFSLTTVAFGCAAPAATCGPFSVSATRL